MKLIKVEYLEESTEAMFFNVTIKTSSFLFAEKEITRRAFIKKWRSFKDSGFGYANNFQWSDNTSNNHQYDEAIIQEMILAYENNKNK